MIFFLVILAVLSVFKLGPILIKGGVVKLERGYERRQRDKWHNEKRRIVQEGSDYWVAKHKERYANDPVFRAETDAYNAKILAEIYAKQKP